MPSSEYEPLVPLADLSSEPSDLDQVRRLFARSADRFLRSPLSWLLWAVLLAGAALLTRRLAASGPAAVVMLWSVAILIGGSVEAVALLGGRDKHRSELARWVMRSQGNLSIVAVALSVALLWAGQAGLLPALWMLVLGHSFYAHGGLGFPPFRVAGMIYQGGGLAALVPGVDALLAFAVFAGAGNLWLAYAVWRRKRE